eukprot:1550175-Amphidinium_carterae.1
MPSQRPNSIGQNQTVHASNIKKRQTLNKLKLQHEFAQLLSISVGTGHLETSQIVDMEDIYARYNTETSLDSDIPPEGQAVLGGGTLPEL